MQFYYGLPSKYINVTHEVYTKCVKGDKIVLPKGDVARADLFGDPVPFQLKHMIYSSGDRYSVLHSTETIEFPVPNNIKYAGQFYQYPGDVDKKLTELHSTLKFVGGSMSEEYPEQAMAVRFISPDAKVLELGSNYGRNTLIISSVVANSENVVTMETSSEYAKVLAENRAANDMKFHIVNAALSKTKLYQKGWECFPDGHPRVDASYKPVAIVNYEELTQKYVKFDTLVADCEGSLFYIFPEFPELLKDVKRVIMENDYHDIQHKVAVDNHLTQNGFVCLYSEAGGWGPCRGNFFEVWHKF